MKKIYLIAMACLCIASVSCQKNDLNDLDKMSSQLLENEMAFIPKSSSTSATKAYSSNIDTTGLSNLDSLFVAAYLKKAGSYVEDFNNAVFKKVNGSDSLFHGIPAKFWPAESAWGTGENQDKYSFYASSLGLIYGQSNNAPAVTASIGTEEGNTNKDVVCMYCPDPIRGVQNSVTMEHIFSRITTVIVGSPVGKDPEFKYQQKVMDLSITIRPDTSGTFNLLLGLDPEREYMKKTSDEQKKDPDNAGWTVKTTAKDSINIVDFTEIEASIDKAEKDTTFNDIYLIPGTYTLYASYKLKKGDNTQEFKKKNTVVIRRGYNNIIKTTLPGTNVEEIIFDVEVKPWEDNIIELGEDTWE